MSLGAGIRLLELVALSLRLHTGSKRDWAQPGVGQRGFDLFGG